MKNLEKLFEEAQTELKTMIVFHKAERTFRAAESHVFKDHQLTPTQFSVLETLYSKGDLRIQNLIDSILATSGNMTVVIRNMVRDGWIKREIDPDDRRACIVSLTEKGRKKIIFQRAFFGLKSIHLIIFDADYKRIPLPRGCP